REPGSSYRLITLQDLPAPWMEGSRPGSPPMPDLGGCCVKGLISPDALEETPMKAAVLHAPNQPLTIEEVALTKPGSRDVLLRTAFAGLCHSDLHFIEGLYPHPTPCVLGHESAGVVEAVGDGVTYVKQGDHVITCLSVLCGTCSQCVTGHANLCENTEVKLPPGVSRRLTWKGGELMNQFL